MTYDESSGTGNLRLRRIVHYSFLMILPGILYAALAALQMRAPAQTAVTSHEYDVKAVFLYNFTRYMRWPGEVKTKVFTITVLGESQIIAPLREIAGKKTVGTIPIEIRQCSVLEEIGRPRILFISKSALPKLSQVLAKIRGTDILSVGESEGFGSRGVAVNFILREGSVRFEMNEKAIREARIQISSQLLKLAILVDQGKG